MNALMLLLRKEIHHHENGLLQKRVKPSYGLWLSCALLPFHLPHGMTQQEDLSLLHVAPGPWTSQPQ